MSKQTTKMLVPKLRFPEFIDSPEWQNICLEKSLSLTLRKRKKPTVNYTGLGMRSHGKGTFLKISQDPKKNSMEYLYEVQGNDLVVSITFAWEGALALTQKGDEGALVSHRFPTYTFQREVAIPEFFRYIVLNSYFVYSLGVISPGGAGRNRVLSKKDFLKLSVYQPNIEEQQKIANCLSSIDELITAHSQKHEALKAHKKGLMQQLFPATGETVPKLRFPEFRDAGEWSEAKLHDKEISDFIKDRTPLDQIDIESYISTENLLPDYAGIKTATKLPPSGSFTQFRKKDVLISNIRPYLNKVWQAQKDGSASNDVIVIRAKTKILDNFLIFILKNDDFINYVMKGAKGVKMPRGDIDSIKKYPLCYPSENEQQKIADCLSSIDDLITTQAQKIESLKAHKKGLMQQLFPAVDEVNG